MTRYFLGIDIGSSKSHAAISSESGDIVGFAEGPAGNHEGVGEAGFRQVVHQITNHALADADLKAQQISGMGFGVAGYDWKSDDEMMHRVIGSLPVTAPYAFVNDAVIGLIAGAKEGWGVSVVAGTSCNCWGRGPDGKEGRVTGNGMLFGEYGGGAELVRVALAAISRQWSLRGPETLLTPYFVDHFQAANAADLLEGIARGRYQPNAQLAPLVFQAVEDQDAVALSLIEWIGEGLGDLAVGVIRQLDITDQAFEVVLAGGFYNGTPLIAKNVKKVVQRSAPLASFTRLVAPPVVGAVMLGMEQVHVDFRLFRDQMIAATQKRFASLYA